MSQSDAKHIVETFCIAWFHNCDADETLKYLTEDVQFIGTGKREAASGKAEMTVYVHEDISEIYEPFDIDLDFNYEQHLSESLISVSTNCILKNSTYAWHLTAFFTLVHKDGNWLICNLHFSEPGIHQKDNEHYPNEKVIESVMKQRQEILNEAIAGGMMGGYFEKDFPFYFINQRMLDYLGYADEAEFVSDIQGKITNCMHPDDRKRVDLEVYENLAANDEYVVEYRMKKKDGTYICVHDTGRKIVAENGRDAIVSVCIDITEQRHAQEEVLNLYNNIPGAVFRCRFDND